MVQRKRMIVINITVTELKGIIDMALKGRLCDNKMLIFN